MNGDAVKIQQPVYANVPVETAMLATNLFGTTTQIAAPTAAAHIPLITAAAAAAAGATTTVAAAAPPSAQPAQHPQQQQQHPQQQHPHQQQPQLITHTHASHAHAVAVAAAAQQQQQQQQQIQQQQQTTQQTIQTVQAVPSAAIQTATGQVHLQAHPHSHPHQPHPHPHTGQQQHLQYGHPAQQVSQVVPTLPSTGQDPGIQANAIDNTEYIMNGAIAQTQDGNLVCYSTEALVPGVNNTNLVALEQQQPDLLPQQQQLAADECGIPLDKLKQMLATQLDYYFCRYDP